MTVALKQYTDIDLNFEPHPITGDVSLLTDSDAVCRSVKNLVMTGNYERIFNPDLGCGVKQSMFEPATPILQYKIQDAITTILETYEPRITLIGVLVFLEPDILTVKIAIIFEILNLSGRFKVDVFLERAR